MRNRNVTIIASRPRRISYQEANVNTEKKSGTFSISVKGDDDKVLYENKEEPFEYNQYASIYDILANEGAKLGDDVISFMGQALAGEENGKAVKRIVDLYNAKEKADAKSSAYAGLVNKYKPLEGEKKESAQARLVANFIKLAGVSKETAIENLRNAKALPEDYTVADFDATPLRRTKGDSDE